MRAQSRRPAYVDEAEGRASELRRQLGLGSDAVADVFDLLQHLGLEPVRWPMGENGPDGFYVRKGDLVIVAINSAKRFGRQRFTACHELAHHLFDAESRIDADVFDGQAVPELRANAFSAYFLMPAEGVQRWLGGKGLQADVDLDAEAVVHLTRHFGVSYEAALYQLRELGRLTPRQADALRGAQPERVARWLGYSLDEDERERGRRVLPPDFVRRTLWAYADGEISLARLAELLRTNEAEAAERAREAGAEPVEASLDELFEEARRA